MLQLQYLCVVSAYNGDFFSTHFWYWSEEGMHTNVAQSEHTLPSMMLLLVWCSYCEHALTESILCIVQWLIATVYYPHHSIHKHIQRAMSQRKECLHDVYELRVYNLYCLFCDRSGRYIDMGDARDEGWCAVEGLNFCPVHAVDVPECYTRDDSD